MEPAPKEIQDGCLHVFEWNRCLHCDANLYHEILKTYGARAISALGAELLFLNHDPRSGILLISLYSVSEKRCLAVDVECPGEQVDIVSAMLLEVAANWLNYKCQ